MCIKCIFEPSMLCYVKTCYVMPETIPVCEDIAYDGLHIRMGCSVNFNGNWPPTMEWSRQEIYVAYQVVHRITSGIEYIINTGHVSSTLNATLYSTKKFYFSCKIYFAGYSGNTTVTAINAPDFVYLWNSSVGLIVSRINSELDTTNDKTGISAFNVSTPDSTSQMTFNSCKSKDSPINMIYNLILRIK